MSDVAKKVETLMEAMPYLEKYQGKVIVIKYGGNAMINESLKNAVICHAAAVRKTAYASELS